MLGLDKNDLSNLRGKKFRHKKQNLVGWKIQIQSTKTKNKKKCVGGKVFYL